VCNFKPNFKVFVFYLTIAFKTERHNLKLTMWKRIRNIFKTNSQVEESPSVLIQRAIHEMTLSIQDSNVAIKNAQASQYEIQKKLDAYKADVARLQKEATDLAKKKERTRGKAGLGAKRIDR
jgi:peptidoglycan hydrolase CwlO-like protein